MSEQSWRPLFRAPKSTITRILSSPAFIRSRRAAVTISADAVLLRQLADGVEALDHRSAPLSAVADRVAAAVGLLRARALHVEALGQDDPDHARIPPGTDAAPAPITAEARERLVIAALHYLLTPVDLVPDFRAGGYIDDVLLLGWVFGAAVDQLEPFLDEGA